MVQRFRDLYESIMSRPLLWTDDKVAAFLAGHKVFTEAYMLMLAPTLLQEVEHYVYSAEDPAASELARIKKLYKELYSEECKTDDNTIQYYIDTFNMSRLSGVADVLTTMANDAGIPTSASDRPITVEAAKLLMPNWNNSGQMDSKKLEDLLVLVNSSDMDHFGTLYNMINGYNMKMWDTSNVWQKVYPLADEAIALFEEMFGVRPDISKDELVDTEFRRADVFNVETMRSQQDVWMRALFDRCYSTRRGFLVSAFLQEWHERYKLYLEPEVVVSDHIEDTLFKFRVLSTQAIHEYAADICWEHLRANYSTLAKYIISAASGIHWDVYSTRPAAGLMVKALIQNHVTSFKDMLRTAPIWISGGFTQEDLMKQYTNTECCITWVCPSTASRGGRGYIGRYRNQFAAWKGFCILQDSYEDIQQPMCKFSNTDCMALNVGQLYYMLENKLGTLPENWDKVVDSALIQLGISDTVQFWTRIDDIITYCIDRMVD